MEARFENGRNMWGTTESVLAKYEAAFNKRAPFVRYVAKFREAKALMDAAAVKQGKEITGIREEKEHLLFRAAQKADYLGDIVQAYALDTENRELYRAMMFGTSDLTTLRDNLAYDKLMEVIDTVLKYAPELPEYGYEEEDLAELKALTEAFKQKIHAPRGAIADRSVATDDIEAIYVMGYNALHVMDKMINTFAKEHPEFVAEYKKARVIVDNRGGRKVKDEE